MGDRQTVLMILQAICLVVMVIAALTNQSLPLGYSVGLSLTLMYLSFIKDLKRGLLIGGTWFIVWCICFSLIYYFWSLYYGKIPDYTIAGLHPGYFILWPTLWLITFVVTTLSYALFFKKIVLSDEEWEKFREQLSKLKG
jgi:hypothetical protein